MANPAGESSEGVLRLDFDRRLTVQFRGSVLTSDAGLLAYRELDDALRLSAMAGEHLADARTGKNGRHACLYVTFQIAEVAIPRQLFASILQRIAALRLLPIAATT